LREAAVVLDVRAARGREVTDVGVVRSLAVVEALDELRDQEVEIHVALTVRMGREVHLHAHHASQEVGPVVEVEAAQEVLVRLPRAAVLGDDHAGHELEHVGWTQRRAGLDLALADAALRRRGRRAEELSRRRSDDNLGRDHFRGGRRAARLGQADARVRQRDA